MDKLRPGWRERQAKKKSPWNLLGAIVALGLGLVFWYVLFQAAWGLHVKLYPEHAALKKEFWGKGISLKAFIPSFLMLMPLGFPAIIAGALSGNCLLWLIPAARRAMESEAAGDREITFAGSNAGLIKRGGLVSLLCLILSCIGIVALKSLK